MFDTAYIFHLLDHKQVFVDGSRLATWKYNFRSHRFFGTETFEHAQSVKHSAYLLINRSHHPVDQFKSQAEAMFASLYVALEA